MDIFFKKKVLNNVGFFFLSSYNMLDYYQKFKDFLRKGRYEMCSCDQSLISVSFTRDLKPSKGQHKTKMSLLLFPYNYNSHHFLIGDHSIMYVPSLSCSWRLCSIFLLHKNKRKFPHNLHFRIYFIAQIQRTKFMKKHRSFISILFNRYIRSQYCIILWIFLSIQWANLIKM